MKHIWKWAGLALLGLTGVASLGTDGSGSSYQRKELKKESLSKLTVRSGSGEVTISKTDGPPFAELRIEREGLHIGGDAELIVEQDTDAALIQVKWEPAVHIGRCRYFLNIFLPEHAVNEIQVDIGSGKGICSGFAFQKSSWNIASGEFDLMQVCSEELSVSVASGLFKLNQGRTKKAEVNVVSGKAFLTVSGEETELTSSITSGRLEAVGSFSQVDAHCTSGRIVVRSDTAPRKMACKVFSGSILARFPETPEGFRAEYHAGSGRIHSDFCHITGGSGVAEAGAGLGDYRFHVTSGKIILERA